MAVRPAPRALLDRHKARLPAVTLADEVGAGQTAGSSMALVAIRKALGNTDDEALRSAIAERLTKLERLEEERQSQGAELDRCRVDLAYWVRTYCWTYDPRLAQGYMPFEPWPKQLDYLAWLADLQDRRSDGVCEKSRDQGATWLSVVFLLHRWLFYPGFKGGIASRKEALLDRHGDPDSIFEKLRMAIRLLPWWMLPRGFDPRRHLAYLKVINPATGATITGEAGDNIGRGGRSTVYMIDEAAFLSRPEVAEAALSLASDCKVYVSTPNGIGNPFYRKRFSGAYPVFTLHWMDDPRKNRWEVQGADGAVVCAGDGVPPSTTAGGTVIYPWYEGMKAKYRHEPVVLAQEVDIDYSASQEGVTIPHAWVRAAVGLRLDTTGPVIAALDIADEGGARNVLTIRQGPTVLAVYSWARGNTTQTAWKAINLCERHGVTRMAYDAGGGYGSGMRAIAESTDRPVTIAIRGVNAGATPTDDRWDGERSSRERFVNLKAELWWKMRRRFERAYEYVTQGIEHPHEDMISLPDLPDLLQELSVVQHFQTETGKVQIESKAQLRRRGVKSPDYADSLVLTEARLSSFHAVSGGTASYNGGDIAAVQTSLRETLRVVS